MPRTAKLVRWGALLLPFIIGVTLFTGNVLISKAKSAASVASCELITGTGGNIQLALPAGITPSVAKALVNPQNQPLFSLNCQTSPGNGKGPPNGKGPNKSAASCELVAGAGGKTQLILPAGITPSVAKALVNPQNQPLFSLNCQTGPGNGKGPPNGKGPNKSAASCELVAGAGGKTQLILPAGITPSAAKALVNPQNQPLFSLNCQTGPGNGKGPPNGKGPNKSAASCELVAGAGGKTQLILPAGITPSAAKALVNPQNQPLFSLNCQTGPGNGKGPPNGKGPNKSAASCELVAGAGGKTQLILPAGITPSAAKVLVNPQNQPLFSLNCQTSPGKGKGSDDNKGDDDKGDD